jgi:hypothetical protein
MKHSEARLKEQFSELESNIHLRQECALDLLHVLGSIEETDNEGHEAVQNTTSQRGGDLPVLTPSGYDGADQGNASPKPPSSPEDQSSPEEGLAIDAQTQLQPQTLVEKFFDLSSLHSCTYITSKGGHSGRKKTSAWQC